VGRSQHGFEDVRRDFGRDATTIGVRLKWNLFDGFRTDNRARQAYAASERARLNIAHLKQRTTTEWHQKLSREASTRDQVRLAEKQLELSRAKLRIAAQRLQARLISELQYRQAKQATEDAMTNVETAKIDVLVAQVERQLAALE
jgi:outer membrane protein TolC